MLPLQGVFVFGGCFPSPLGWAKVYWPFRPEEDECRGKKVENGVMMC